MVAPMVLVAIDTQDYYSTAPQGGTKSSTVLATEKIEVPPYYPGWGIPYTPARSTVAMR